MRAGQLPFLALGLVLVAFDISSAFVLQPRLATPQSTNRVSVAMQFKGPDKPGGLTRDNEPEEFFSTNMDDMSDEEKLKSPVSYRLPSFDQSLRCPQVCFSHLRVPCAGSHRWR